MRRPALSIALAMLLLPAVAAMPAFAQNVDPKSDFGQFRDLRSAGVSAMDSNDPTTALDDFDKAAAILPDSPSILLLTAQLLIGQHRDDDARAVLTNYLRRGYVIDLKKNPDFNAVWDGNLDDLQMANQGPVGEMHVAATLPGFTIAEGVAVDAGSGQIYISGVHDGSITALSADAPKTVITFRPGVAAYGLGLRDGKIWASTQATRQTKGYSAKAAIASKLLVIDPATGKVTGQFSDPGHHFGHMLLGKDDLYVADTGSGAILRLSGYQGTFQTLVPEGYMDTPDGLAENADGSALLVADFVSGLYRVDLTQGSLVRVPAPDGVSTLGLSSLARYGNDIIAIQNGFNPNRVLRLHMSADWRSIQSAEVLLRSDKLLSQPSQGVVADDHFLFVAQSQWSNLDDQGNAISDSPDPAVVGVIKLDPAAQ